MAQTEQRISHFFAGLGVSLDRLSLLERRHGRYCTIRIFTHPELGRVFVLGNEVQHVEAWAPLYHEPLVHLAAAFVPEVQHAIILGGGTLFAAAEVLKYRSVKRIVLIDHDPEVIASAAKFYPHARRCLADGRLQIVVDDAYGRESTERGRFDLVINDGLDLLEIPGSPRSRDIFARLSRLAAPHGVCSDLIQRHVFERRRTQMTVARLRRDYRVALSLVTAPEYHGALHILTIWGSQASKVSQGLVLPANVQQLSWWRRPATIPCVYYDPRFLSYYFYLPKYLRSFLKGNSA